MERVMKNHKETFEALAEYEELEKIEPMNIPDNLELVENLKNSTPTEEQATKEMSCPTCHSRLVSKAELTGAVQFIHATLNTFRERVRNLMGTQAKRVLEAIIESPLEQEVKSFTTKEAMKCFELGVAIKSAQYVLFQGSRNQYDDLAQDIEEQMKLDEPSPEVAPYSEESVTLSEVENNVTQQEGN